MNYTRLETCAATGRNSANRGDKEYNPMIVGIDASWDQKMVANWAFIAERFKDDQVVAGWANARLAEMLR